jgi:hypothetical protein
MRSVERSVVACLSLVLAVSACEPSFGGVEIQQRTSTPETVDVTIENDEVSMPLGLAVGVWVEIRSGSVKRYSADDEVGLASEDDSIMTVYPITGRTEEWLLVGASVGETCLLVSINDKVEEDCVRAIVTDPLGG